MDEDVIIFKDEIRVLSLEKICEIVAWIDLNLGDKINIDSVVKESGYSKWHFQRYFKTITGYSLARYIRLRRLTECAILLKGTQKKIIIIALDHDFDSQQTFTRTFKKYFGVSPHYYRSKNINLAHMYIDTWRANTKGGLYDIEGCFGGSKLPLEQDVNSFYIDGRWFF